MSVNSINPVSQGTGALRTAVTQTDDENEVGFADLLNNAMNKVNDLLVQSDDIAAEFAAGKTDNIHEVLIASEKADIALQLTMQIRNKLLDAYNEIMRMQV